MEEERKPEFMSGVGPGGEIVPIQDVCGSIFPIPFIREVGFSQAMVETTRPSTPHYHKVGFETYYIVSGTGRVMVGDVIFEVGPDCFIQIEPMTAHCILPYEGMLIFVTNSPPWAEDDQFVLSETNADVRYDEEFERRALEDLLLRVADLNPVASTMSRLSLLDKEELRETVETYIV